MKAIAVPSEHPRMIIISYADGQPVDPKIIEWTVNHLNKVFSEIDPPPQASE